MDDISTSNSLTSPMLLSQTSLDTNKWWIIIINKVIDVEEARNQILFSLPMIVVTSCFYLINLVSVMLTGHLGKLELAAPNLANSWAVVTGLSFMIGLSGALETLCGQGYGAKMYRMLGIHLQTSCIISFIFSTTIAVIWWYSDRILILVHQDPDIAKEAGVFLKLLIPGLLAYGFLQNILRFLQEQSIIKPLVVCSVACLVIHIRIAYGLVHWTSLGFNGAPLAASISIWMSVLTLGIYVLFSERFSHIWRDGLSLEPFHYVVTNLKLALPSAVMVCVNTEAIAYTISYGLSAAASTRVANELGAGNPNKAKHAMVGWLGMWMATFGYVYQLGNILFHWHANSCPPCFQVQLTCSGFMDGLDMWSSLPSMWLIAIAIVHQMGKSRCINKEQYRK
ncbi:hypothetical protein P3L10_027477 [Capsicum annuum]